MKPALALTLGAAFIAAGALLAYAVKRQPDPGGDAATADEPPSDWFLDPAAPAPATDATPQPDWTNEVDASISAARNLVLPTPAADMQPSAELIAMLKHGEGLKLGRYRLGDGGWTLGYGRYFADGSTPPPESISLATADEWFMADVEARGARWVRTYVTAPLTQTQFDALVSMAFNLKPSSFRTIAEAVNAGDDPEAASLRFVRAGSNLERGLRNRRGREVALYREGTYA